MYRLVLSDTAVMIIIHLIYDPLQSLLLLCCSRKRPHEEENKVADKNQETPKPCFLLEPLEFQIENYVLDLTYTQTLCWYVKI